VPEAALPRLISLAEKLNSIEIKRAVTHFAGDSHWLITLRGPKFYLELSADRKVRDGEQAHATITQVDSEAIKMSRPGEHLHRCVHPLTTRTAHRPKIAFEEHGFLDGVGGKQRVARSSRISKITDGH